MDLDLDLDSTRIQDSKCMHWATLRRHADLLWWAAISASPRVIPIHVLVDCAPPVCTRTTWTSLKPWNMQVQRLSRYMYALMIHSCPSQRSLLSLSMSSILSISIFIFIHHKVAIKIIINSTRLWPLRLLLCPPGNAQEAPLPSVMNSVQSFR